MGFALTRRFAFLAVLWLCAPGSLLAAASIEAGRYLETDAYLQSAFVAEVPAARTLWVSGELRTSLEQVLGHPFGRLRVRFWQHGARSAWILDEIGKELPITIGVTVDSGAIENVRVLEFRESRGWEVRYPFFTEQFVEARLGADDRLDRKIDGITGATLSVGAVTRIARVALLLHDHVVADAQVAGGE